MMEKYSVKVEEQKPQPAVTSKHLILHTIMCTSTFDWGYRHLIPGQEGLGPDPVFLLLAYLSILDPDLEKERPA